MAGSLQARKRRTLSSPCVEEVHVSTRTVIPSSLNFQAVSSDIEVYAKEVLDSLISDNIPPTPHNYSLYFDRLLEEKSEYLRKQILSVLELEESNDAESTILLEHTLKQGFSSIKNILNVTANLYKNMSLMTKILEKRKKELKDNPEPRESLVILEALESDVSKLNTIVKSQSSQMRVIYDNTASIVKNVENETIFDNQFGVYNKRYLLTKLEQEMDLVKEFKHRSSLIMLELSNELKASMKNEKAVTLMTRTIARLLLKTSRRSDIVAYYGHGAFVMLLKHTDIDSARKASERLCDLVSNSNFFLEDKEIQLKISIGITSVDTDSSVEEIILSAMDGMELAYKNENKDYVVSLRT